MGLNCCERGRKKPNERAGRKERIKGEGEQTFWAAVTSALRSERLTAGSARASPKKVHPFLILLRRRRWRGDTLPANITEGDSGGGGARAEKFSLFCLVRNPKRKERGADGKVGCQTKLLQDAMCPLLVPRLSLQSMQIPSRAQISRPCRQVR